MADSRIAHIDKLQRSLGHRIRELRSKHGWTQEQFAEFCGLHRTYVGHVERGEKNVSLSTVLRLANALGVRISALFGGSRSASMDSPLHLRPPMTRSKGSPVDSPEVERLLEELRSQRKALRQALRDLSGYLVRLTELVS